MRSLIIFPLVVVAVPPLSLCPPSLALSAEDDGNDSLLRTLQISPISEDGRAAVSQGRFHCCPVRGMRGVRGVRVLMGRLMRQSSPRARAVEVGPVIIRRNGVRILRGTTELAVIESRVPRRRCEMLINIWPGGGQNRGRMEGRGPPSPSLSLSVPTRQVLLHSPSFV